MKLIIDARLISNNKKGVILKIPDKKTLDKVLSKFKTDKVRITIEEVKKNANSKKKR